jgi:hypothetical protein
VGQARGGALWIRFTSVRVTHIAMMTPAARSSRGPIKRRGLAVPAAFFDCSRSGSRSTLFGFGRFVVFCRRAPLADS